MTKGEALGRNRRHRNKGKGPQETVELVDYRTSQLLNNIDDLAKMVPVHQISIVPEITKTTRVGGTDQPNVYKLMVDTDTAHGFKFQAVVPIYIKVGDNIQNYY